MESVQLALWGNTLEFYTHPDLFSPRKPDSGSLAMLKQIELSSDDKVLDLGCGYGLVGIAIAAKIGADKVTMVDIDNKAVELAKLNAQRNSLKGLDICQSDALSALSATDYTLILSNPPYHSDFSVPKRFIEEGFRHLRVGGKMVMVVKRLTWYKNKLTSVFGGVRIREQDGYYVLSSVKKNAQGLPPSKKTVKKKHKKRLERSYKRNSRKKKPQ